jgi:hypothetical protein
MTNKASTISNKYIVKNVYLYTYVKFELSYFLHAFNIIYLSEGQKVMIIFFLIIDQNEIMSIFISSNEKIQVFFG